MSLLVALLAEAIAHYEGFYQRGTIAQRQHNPGNLRRWGGYPVEGGFARFPSAAEGFRALRRQVQLNIGRGLTLAEFFAGKPDVYPGYAPAQDLNRPERYAAFASEFLAARGMRVAPGDRLDSLDLDA